MSAIDRKRTEQPSSYHAQERLEMLEFIPDDVNILLDVGCGEGRFGATFKEKRKGEVWGIELVAHAAENAQSKLDHVYVGNVEVDEFGLPQAYFDCVVFNDCLEHLNDPWGVLRKTKRLLKTNGYVVASIPNIRYFEQVKNLAFKGEWEYTAAGLMDRTHLRFFTHKSAVKMFEDNGYAVIRSDGIGYCWKSWRFNVLNWALRGRLDDMRYIQFAYVAQKLSDN